MMMLHWAVLCGCSTSFNRLLFDFQVGNNEKMSRENSINIYHCQYGNTDRERERDSLLLNVNIYKR